MASTTGPASGTDVPTGTRQTAPLGVKLYCALGGLGAFFGLLVSLRFVVEGGTVTLFGFLLLGYVIGLAIVLYGLWTLESWAWPWAMALQGLSFAYFLVTMQILSLSVAFLLLAYLGAQRSYYRRERQPI